MDIEKVFMSCYKIKKQLDDIFNLIELALRVGAFKYQPQFEKHKARIIKFLMNRSLTSIDDDDDDEKAIEDNVGDEDNVTYIEESDRERSNQYTAADYCPKQEALDQEDGASYSYEETEQLQCNYNIDGKRHGVEEPTVETEPQRIQEDGE
ncbi:hypothetical protein MTR67_004294 [Solanum verrucosum]|uniref:Uncharacterized protein n=1 Tax=Solanum verrucosum TaxID=315347 RepID=A0AAF0PZQ7_SOLVR|nr:hypothetical protein MTR67_004294 [Solanum verrucosum]